MQLRPVGNAALLLEVDDPPAWFAALTAERTAGRLAVLDIVPGARTVLLDGVDDPRSLAEFLRTWSPPALSASTPEPIVLDVRFDGADLPFVASHVGLSVDGLVECLTGLELTVAFCGFAPGFAYLAGLPWTVPRLDSPRARVPVGSVALAAEFAGVYPTASPGGWRLIGRTAAVLFDVDRDPPALLAPGRAVRFEAA